MRTRTVLASSILLVFTLILTTPGRAAAQSAAGDLVRLPVSFLPAAAPAPDGIAAIAAAADLPAPARPDLHATFASIDAAPPASVIQARPVVVEYSDAYRTRAKIHRYASFATLPLFAAEAFVGQSLYNNPTPGKRDAHLAIAGAMGGLFAVNTVTGVWNLVEARKDPNGRTRRMAHGLLMLAADAGFLATAALGPGHEREFGEGGEGGSRSAHRAMAFTSISLATVGYLVMLIGGK
ncbi:MAG: hypothetical protein R2752_05465 [Vicinamibacterales bacterium]